MIAFYFIFCDEKSYPLPSQAALKEAGQTVREQSNIQESLYRQMFKLKATHLLACFALAYVGAEVTLGGDPALFLPEIRV